MKKLSKINMALQTVRETTFFRVNNRSSLKTDSIRLQKILVRAILLLGMALPILSGCEKDSKPKGWSGPYSNTNDDTTTDIVLTIPRIEISPLKSTQVRLFLSITDQNGNPFTDFNKYNFTISQVCSGETDTTDITSISFSQFNQQGGNIAVAMTLDYSESMSAEDREDMEDAVKYFINLKKPYDQEEIIKFASYIEVVAPFTSNIDTLLLSINQYVYLGDMTSLYDVIDLGISDANDFITQNSSYLPAIIGFTDGEDTYSDLDIFDVIENAQVSQIPVYCLGFGDANTYILNTLADETGGRYYYAPEPSDLQDLYALINGQLQNIYVVTWVYDGSDCDEVAIIVESSYTCANGKLHSTAIKYFNPF